MFFSVDVFVLPGLLKIIFLKMNVKRLLNTFAQFNLVYSNGDRLRVPVFKVKATNISVIKSPTEFYNTLMDLAEKSEKRISISSLYLGTGTLEKDLVNSLSTTKSKFDNLEMTVLLDYNRATRETLTKDETTGHQTRSSSKSLLLPLVKMGAKVNFYMTINLSGWKRWIQQTPKWNELSSLHHMKLYIFDDHLIISGANLGDTYFTTRQDRYILLRDSPELCNYFDELIKTVSQFSFSLQEDGQFQLHSTWKFDPRKYWHQWAFQKSAQQSIRQLNERFSREKVLVDDTDTIVFPLLQLKTLGISDEEQFTSSLLQSCTAPGHRLHIGTGYFNLTKTYQNTLLNPSSDNQSSTSIVMASEEANGFYNGGGILRFIPLVYTHYVRSFLKRIQEEKREKDTAIWYYNKPGWSFHAKGIWFFTPTFCLTIVGSTNFGYRSVYRDSEAQIVIVSKNKDLKKAFESEHQALIDNSKQIVDQKVDLPPVPLWVASFATLFRSYF